MSSHNGDATSSLIDIVSKLLPAGCHMSLSRSFYWSPKTRTLHYAEERLTTDEGRSALLHEAGHAILGHQSYRLDAELVVREAEAWQKARELALALNITLDSNHIEDCLDTYREWLYARSTCPSCQSSGLQLNKTTYSCFTCQTAWNVSPSRFCRAYRMVSRRQEKTPPQQHTPVTVFSERAT